MPLEQVQAGLSGAELVNVVKEAAWLAEWPGCMGEPLGVPCVQRRTGSRRTPALSHTLLLGAGSFACCPTT